MSVLRAGTVCYLHLSWFKLLTGSHRTTGRRKLRSRARSHASCVWISAGPVSKTWFSLSFWWDNFMNTWNCSSPWEFMKWERVFLFVWLSVPLAQIVLLTGVFKIGLIKAHSPPAQYHNLTKFVQCWKPWARYLKSDSGEQNGNSSPCALELQGTCACTGYPWAGYPFWGEGRSIYSSGWKPAAGGAPRRCDSLYNDDLHPPGKWNRSSPTCSPVITHL